MFEELINKIIELDNLDSIADELKELHPYDIAQIYNELSEDNQKKLLSVFTDTELADILAYQEADDASDILEEMPEEQAAAIISEMESDDAQDVLDEMEEDAAEAVKQHLDEDFLEDINTLSQYEEGSAGAIMTSSFLKVLVNSSVKEATKVVTKEAPNAETINTIFVVDEKDTLIGVVDLKELICARMPKTVNDIMLTNYVFVNVNDDFDTISKLVNDYDLKALPVLNNGIIEGIITMDDAFDALTDSAEEDYAKLAGLTEDEDDDEKVFSSVKKRIPWLAVLLVLDILIAIVISRFNNVISNPDLVMLTFFQAALLGLSGNCGTQSLAISVRRISQGLTNDKKENTKFIIHDIVQALGLSIILALIGFIFVYGMLLIKNALGLSSYESIFIFKLACVLSISILIAVIFANFTGTVLPLLFDKMHIDPAVASGPFITTLNDIIAIVIYFTMAIIFFSAYL